VWDATKVRDLMIVFLHLFGGYPVGYIIAWRNSDVRLKDGTISAGRKVLIDGQQRVTALNAAMVGRKVVNQDYQQIRIRIAFNPMCETFEVLNTAIEKSAGWIHNIAPVIQGEIGMMRLMREYLEKNPQDG
jgi:hypothetical protein